MTASICAALACNSTAMVGIATLTTKASTPNMNCAATTIASTHQRREVSTGVVTIWCMTDLLVVSANIARIGHASDYVRGNGATHKAVNAAGFGCDGYGNSFRGVWMLSSRRSERTASAEPRPITT